MVRVSSRFTIALDWMTEAAKKGFARSQYYLGKIYFTGNKAEQDYEEAVKWSHMSAGQGDAWAQYGLGTAYRYGMGVDQDNGQAYAWTYLSARGYEKAKDLLAELSEKYGHRSTHRSKGSC